MKDYAKLSKRQKKFKRNLWIKAAIILVLGIFSLTLIQVYRDRLFLKTTIPSDSTKIIKLSRKMQTNLRALTNQNQTKKKQQTQFDFYQMLPNMTVSIPKGNETNFTNKNIATNYLLQIASTKSREDAKDLTTQLIKQKFQAFIKVMKQNDTVWYRIVSGPYHDLNQAKYVQYQLYKKFNINSILVTTSTSTQK